MPNASFVKINPSQSINDEGDSVVNSELFGGIYTTFQHKSAGLSDYSNHSDTLGLTHIRWPGGTFAKSKKDTNDWDDDGDVDEFVYDLSNPDVNLKADSTGNSEFGLSGVLEHCVAEGMSFSMIVPVQRYYDDPSHGQDVMFDFLTRLLIDKEFGELPDDFTLEMGNENMSSGDIQTAAAYAQTSDALTHVVRTFNENPELNPDDVTLRVAFQGGPDPETDKVVRESISSENLQTIDQVVHHYLSMNIRNLQNKIEEREPQIEEWHDLLGEDLQLFASAWTVGVSKYPTDGDHSYIDAGAEVGRTVLETFSSFVESGVDKAALWGVDLNLNENGIPQNPNWFSSGDNGEVVLSHGGHVVQMMAENTIGKTFIFSEGNVTQSGGLINGQFPGLDSVATYAYQDTEELVVYLAANDIDDEGETVTIDVSGFANSGTFELTRLSTIWNDLENPFDDQPLLEVSAVSFSSGLIEVPINQDHEIVQVVLGLNSSVLTGAGPQTIQGTQNQDTFFVNNSQSIIVDPIQGDGDLVTSVVDFNMLNNAINVENLTLSGTAVRGIGNASSNEILGNSSGNHLEGRGGYDLIVGGAGDDTLDGGVGGDTLIGGEGADTMRGGVGDDLYLVENPNDQILELENGGIDMVHTLISTSLWELSREIENLQLLGLEDIGAYGNRADNMMIGNMSNNILNGGRGNDTIRGWNGDDKLIGGSGDDELAGNRGNDHIFGGDGNDVLLGNSGDDTLEGGAGSDTLLGGVGNDTANGGIGEDTFGVQHFGTVLTIQDFQLGVDRLLFYEKALGVGDAEIRQGLSVSEDQNGLLIEYLGIAPDQEFGVLLEGYSAEDSPAILDSLGV